MRAVVVAGGPDDVSRAATEALEDIAHHAGQREVHRLRIVRSARRTIERVRLRVAHEKVDRRIRGGLGVVVRGVDVYWRIGRNKLARRRHRVLVLAREHVLERCVVEATDAMTDGQRLAIL